MTAKFEHDTARPVEGYAAPQLHTHAVILNVTERDNGKTRALDPRSLFETQNHATAVYQADLTYRLRNLGYELERGRSGAPEIKGYSPEYLDASSPRSQQIKERLEQIGRSGPEAAQIAAHATRGGKQDLTADQVLQAHRDMAVAFGNQPEQIVTAAKLRATTQEIRPEGSLAAKEAVTYAKAHIFEREAVADERAIITTAIRRGMGEATFQDIRDEFRNRRDAGEFRSVQAEKYSSGRTFTTPETLAAEHANVRFVREGQNALAPMMSERQAERQSATRDFLNESQRRVIEQVLTSSDRVHGLQGLAGSGKTTALESIREGAEKAGYTVEGFAPTSRAAGQLREANIQAATLQSFLARKEKETDVPKKNLYMLDESSLASSHQMRAFLNKIGPQDRVLVIGDTRQHQGVDAGRPFQQMQEAGMQTSQLDQIMRQKDPELLKAVQHLAAGETEKGIALLHQQGRVKEIQDPQQRITAIAADYAAQPQNTIIVSPDNKSRQQINEAVRLEMTKNGTLSGESRTIATLAHRSDMTGAGRTWADLYKVGDVVQYNTGSKELGLERDSLATIRSVDARANLLTVEKNSGESITYDPRRLRGVNVFQERDRDFAPGDRIQFTTPNKELGVATRDLGTITSLTDHGKMTVALDGKIPRSVSFDTADFRQIDHGYAVTSHSSQGLTTKRVIANIDTDSGRSLINDRLAYVSISRASDDARIYTNNETTLGKRLATDISKTAAVDFRPVTKDAAPEAETTRRRRAPIESKRQPKEVEVRQGSINAFREKDVEKGVALLQEERRIHSYPISDQRLAAVSQDYAARKDRAVVLAPDPSERQELTTRIRADLKTEGRLSLIDRPFAILNERDLGNKKLAANYNVGDEIHYKKGSPEVHGIADDSVGAVTHIDKAKNLLTVEKADGQTATYNPALLKEQTGKSKIFELEEIPIARGERIQITRSEWDKNIRSGNLATVERIGDNDTLSLRLDNGKALELAADQARHIDHGYAVDSTKHLAVDRVIFSGDSHKMLQQQDALAGLSHKVRDLSMHVSESHNPLPDAPNIATPNGPTEGLSNAPNLIEVEPPSVPKIEIEGFSISM